MSTVVETVGSMVVCSYQARSGLMRFLARECARKANEDAAVAT